MKPSDSSYTKRLRESRHIKVPTERRVILIKPPQDGLLLFGRFRPRKPLTDVVSAETTRADLFPSEPAGCQILLNLIDTARQPLATISLFVVPIGKAQLAAPSATELAFKCSIPMTKQVDDSLDANRCCIRHT